MFMEYLFISVFYHDFLTFCFILIKLGFHSNQKKILVCFVFLYIFCLIPFFHRNFLQYVMIVLKGSVPMAFGGTEEPAAYGELVSIGGLNPDVNKKLCAAVSALLETKLSVPKSRFFLKFYDTKASLGPPSSLSRKLV